MKARFSTLLALGLFCSPLAMADLNLNDVQTINTALRRAKRYSLVKEKRNNPKVLEDFKSLFAEGYFSNDDHARNTIDYLQKLQKTFRTLKIESQLVSQTLQDKDGNLIADPANFTDEKFPLETSYADHLSGIKKGRRPRGQRPQRENVTDFALHCVHNKPIYMAAITHDEIVEDCDTNPITGERICITYVITVVDRAEGYYQDFECRITQLSNTVPMDRPVVESRDEF